ncbi:hypothetical protein [Rhodovulum sulfidophilum]|uniref:hypothetical protein n=1 Tax=Rhodovulum sulfidophilum TaxID=35806 RepID=UPI001F21AAE1|nr:hypothetical protein [Rhodovulum sulfidophilum]MCE8438463.1 hypothetical protein [Rhodovulum sulfidophilum]MCE8469228.1 hypothetical protein [Rhodovulum sulfidophilum]
MRHAFGLNSGGEVMDDIAAATRNAAVRRPPGQAGGGQGLHRPARCWDLVLARGIAANGRSGGRGIAP